VNNVLASFNPIAGQMTEMS